MTNELKNYLKSPKFSLSNWKLKEFMKGQLKTIKEIAKVAAPLLFGLIFFKENPTMIVVVTGLAKMSFDIIEFWVKDY